MCGLCLVGTEPLPAATIPAESARRMILPAPTTVQGLPPVPKNSMPKLAAELHHRGLQSSDLPPHQPMSDDSRASYDERGIMSAVSAGQVAAFDRLVDLFWASTFRYCKSLGCDEDRADDITQEAFIRLWERRKSWTHEGSVKVWLFQTVRNQVLSERRKWKVRVAWASREGSEEPPHPTTPLQEVENLELRQAVEHSMAILSPRRREAFALVHLQGLSYREVSQIMNVRPQTVANYLTEALVDLRSSLTARFPSLALRESQVGNSTPYPDD
ncbi:MAG: sigma-70 family RNA polymerase sigma factor [Gemmatimonas sp.]|nr:sigma-70 family RNA polymerase sigma factor [Gemmatimonas sp.]